MIIERKNKEKLKKGVDKQNFGAYNEAHKGKGVFKETLKVSLFIFLVKIRRSILNVICR